MKPKFIFFLALISFNELCCIAQSNDWLYKWQRRTVAIGIKGQYPKNEMKTGELSPCFITIGSGFLAKITDNKKNKTIIGVITAKHVIEANGSQLDSILIRTELHFGTSVFEDIGYSIKLKSEAKPIWIEHPDGADLIFIPLPLDPSMRTGPNKEPIEALSTLDYTFKKSARLGSSVFILGFPAILFPKYHNLPILRKGTIASFDNYDYAQKIILDCIVTPGNSGGPVITAVPEFEIVNNYSNRNQDDQKEDAENFIGVVIQKADEYIPLIDSDKRQVFDANNKPLLVTAPVGLTVVLGTEVVSTLLFHAQRLLLPGSIEEHAFR